METLREVCVWIYFRLLVGVSYGLMTVAKRLLAICGDLNKKAKELKEGAGG